MPTVTQTTTSAINDHVIGATGKIIADILETAGFYGQGQVLDRFGNFLGVLGALLFVYCAVAAIKAIAFSGNYRQGVYFLLGPALFWWMLSDRMEITTTVDLGDTTRGPHDEETILRTLKRSGDASRYEHKARVSWLFFQYNRLISSVMGQVSSLLTDSRNMEDLTLAAQDRIFSRVVRARSTDRDFLRLLAQSFMGDCARQMSLERNLAQPRLATARQGTAEYRERLLREAEYARSKSQAVYFSPDLKAYVKRFGFEAPNPVTCEHLWQYTAAAARVAAADLLRPTREDQVRYPKLDWNKIYTSVRDKLAPVASRDDSRRALEVLAAFYLHNSILSTGHGEFLNQFITHHGINVRKLGRIFGEVANLETPGLRLSIAYVAGALPYLQGVFLLLLATSFPFFCVFLVHPANYRSFFLWMTLWLWVKSWDIGFAAVYVVRGILWRLMPHAGEIRGLGSFSELNWNNPTSVLNVITRNDPTVSLNTYYFIISVLTLIVPLVTAHLCLGASELFSLFSLSIDRTARHIQAFDPKDRRVRYIYGLNADRWNRRMASMNEVAAKAAREPGTSAQGIPREEHRDYTVPRHMWSQAHLAYFGEVEGFKESAFTNPNSHYQELVEHYGEVYGRRMTYEDVGGRYTQWLNDTFDNYANYEKNFTGPWMSQLLGFPSTLGIPGFEIPGLTRPNVLSGEG